MKKNINSDRHNVAQFLINNRKKENNLIFLVVFLLLYFCNFSHSSFADCIRGKEVISSADKKGRQ